jgi:hypothetical protein
MKLWMLAKDAGSGKNGCPSVYLAENGDLVIQGNILDAATAANLINVLPGEAGVSIKAEVVHQALAGLE